MSIKYSGTFHITTAVSITVDGPTGPFNVGDTVYLEWSSTGSVGNVKIQLFKSSSSTATITNSTSNDGTYSWTIQSSQLDGTSSSYKIKIFETDGYPVDYGPYFTINAEIIKSVFDHPLFSETVIDATSIWKIKKVSNDSTLFSESVSSLITNQPLAGDSVSFSEVINDIERSWKKIYTTSDSTAFVESVSSLITSARLADDTVSFSEVINDIERSWKKIYTTSDSTAFVESVSSLITSARLADDTVGFSEAINDITRSWKKIYWINDNTGLSESVSSLITSARLADDTVGFSESVIDSYRLWKKIYITSDSTGFVESVSSLITTATLVTDTVGFSESVIDSYRLWKKIYTTSDSTGFVESVSSLITTARLADDTVGFNESITKLIGTWIKEYDVDDVTGFSESVSSLITTATLVDDTVGFSESITRLIGTWIKEYDTDDVTGFSENIDYQIRQWHYAVSEVIAFVENISDYVPIPTADSVGFIEDVVTAITTANSSHVLQFQTSPTEVYGASRRTGWINASSLSRSTILRRFNIEYNSPDPITVKIFADGDDTHEVYSHILPAAVSPETTNKSVRISRRAKDFMVELSTPPSANDNVIIERISVEVDP